MNEWVGRMPGSLVSEAEDLEREFDVRLADSSTLAFRVAYSDRVAVVLTTPAVPNQRAPS